MHAGQREEGRSGVGVHRPDCRGQGRPVQHRPRLVDDERHHERQAGGRHRPCGADRLTDRGEGRRVQEVGAGLGQRIGLGAVIVGRLVGARRRVE
mgnify:CR=1 FL=1